MRSNLLELAGGLSSLHLALRIALAESGLFGGNPEEKNRNYKAIASYLHGNAE